MTPLHTLSKRDLAKVTYAYNIRLTKPRIEGLNTHMLSLSYAFRVKRLPRDDQRKAAR